MQNGLVVCTMYKFEGVNPHGICRWHCLNWRIQGRFKNTTYKTKRRNKISWILKIDEETTKYLYIWEFYQIDNICVEEENLTFSRENKLQYLGVKCTKYNIEVEVESRWIAKTKSFWSLSKLLRSKEISRPTKLKIYLTIIQPMLLYGTKKQQLKKLIVYEN